MKKTRRKTLANGKRSKKTIDMEKAYQLIDEQEMSVKKVADYFGVHRSTLYKRHKEYQNRIEKEMEDNEFVYIDELPPIPEKYRI